MTNEYKAGKLSIMKCDQCRDGYLIVKPGKENQYFLGCTNYNKDGTGCSNFIAPKLYYEMFKLTQDPAPAKEFPKAKNIQPKTNRSVVEKKQPVVILDKPVVIKKAEIRSVPYGEHDLNDIIHKILQCLSHISEKKYYLSYSARALSLDRFVVNVEGLLWTYSLTGNKELLTKAEEAWAAGMSALTQESCLDDSEFHMHGVTMNELMKIPMILYMHTGEERYLQAALKADYKMETPNMLIDGVNSSTEALAGNDPLASHETCDITDYTWTIGYYLMGTGDGQWADRIEKAIFNAGFGAITKDFHTMQYFSCPNQFIATGNSNHNDFKKGLTWMAYRPVHETECCIGNLHRYFPNYVARMWLKDENGHPVAALYGPSSVTYDLGDGLVVKIKEKTAYPFEEQIDFVFEFYKDGRKSKDAHQMDFTYRIPGWCKSSDISGFHTVSKEWTSGEVFTVALPMDVEVVPNPVEGICIQRGPVVYSYAIPADCEEDTEVYDYLAGKVSANPDFKCWNMTPAGKWNYALVEDKLDDLKVSFTGASGFPFDLENVPVKITVPVVGVEGWTLVEDRYTPALPETVVPESEEVTYIDLVPYGSTTLRLTTFPVY